MRRAAALIALLMIGGCVSNQSPSADVSEARTASPSHYDEQDKPTRMCEDTAIGGTPKTVCY